MEFFLLIIPLVVAGAVAWAWTSYELRERKRIAVQRGKDYMTDFMAQQGYKVGEPFPTTTVPLPSIPVLPIPEYQDYQLEPEAAHLPTWTPTVSHYPDQDEPEAFDPDGYPDMRDMAETVSQDDFDAIGDHEGDD